MLVLTRRQDEDVYIGEGEARIKVTILGVRGGTVKLGIEAPRDQRVLRGEIADTPVPPVGEREARAKNVGPSTGLTDRVRDRRRDVCGAR